MPRGSCSSARATVQLKKKKLRQAAVRRVRQFHPSGNWEKRKGGQNKAEVVRAPARRSNLWLPNELLQDICVCVSQA